MVFPDGGGDLFVGDVIVTVIFVVDGAVIVVNDGVIVIARGYCGS